MTDKTVEIVEKSFVNLKNPIIIEGFPSVGLVGAIATEFLAGELKMEEIGFITSKLLPPVILVKDGEPKAPIRIYAKDNLVVIVSDTAIPTMLSEDIATEIVNWAQEHHAKRIISVGGSQRPAEEENSPLQLYALSPFPDLLKEAESKGMSKVELGFLTGVMGLMMLKCVEKNVPILGLLSDARLGYPDPEAAANIITAINKVLGLEVDTKALMDASKKINERFGALMQTTQKAMQEQTRPNYPTMYG